jgi:HMGL-like
MTDLPTHVEIHEEGPREGFQIEPGPISTADKIKLIETLAETGLHHIQAASFVSQRIVPGWADAEDVVAGFTPKEGVHYTALWFNASGLNRALVFRNKLTITGSISLTASEAFTQKNLHRSHAENIEALKKQTALHLENGVEVPRVGVMAAFGCNYQGDIAPAQVTSTVEDGLAIAEEAGADIKYFSLADTMGWVTPMRIERVLGEVRSRWPDRPIALHLHDTRGLAVANAHAGLRMGVTQFDSTVGGLGGCPFAGQPKAAGKIGGRNPPSSCRHNGSCRDYRVRRLAISFSAPQLAQWQLWRAGRRYPQPAKPLGLRRDRSTVLPPPVLARRDPAIPGLHSRSPPSGPPVFTGKWAPCRQARARNRFPFTVTTPRPVTRRPARSQPRARARKTRPAAALLPM